ncbi:hypothetical protein DEO72_LG8g2095 [Vigna unguiculata]|uniref:Uncharacterized protein n=1 Tax=Vigna unguiculata TaxID=3917 RepID=A0A4D6MTV6_VIGUN|nr:hypothetical protein DEO72_LG8g2095 [Vigna unguiculata]
MECDAMKMETARCCRSYVSFLAWWCSLLQQMRRREDGAAGTRGGRAGDGGVLVRSRWLPWLTRCGEASRRCRFVRRGCHGGGRREEN